VNNTSFLINSDSTCEYLLEHGNIIFGVTAWDDEINELVFSLTKLLFQVVIRFLILEAILYIELITFY
jgi:hypothetical protein